MKHIIFLLFIFISLEAKIIEAQQLFNKKLVSVKEQTLGLKKSFYGQLAVDETRVVDITTRFSGFVEKLYANSLYTKVNKSAPLMSVYSDEVMAASEELLLAKKLHKQKSIYQSALNKLKSLDLNKNSLDKIINTTNSIQNIDIYSPINGYVTQKSVNEKSFIKKGSLILQVADFSKLWFIAKVYQNDLFFIQKGMKASLQLDGIPEQISAEIDYIYPTFNKSDQTVDIRVVVDNTNSNLYPNMFGKVYLAQAARTLLTLPRSAVLTKGDKHYVFKPISPKEFEPVEITAKRINSETFEIISGLEKDEQVIDKVLFMLDSDAITNGLYSSSDDNW